MIFREVKNVIPHEKKIRFVNIWFIKLTFSMIQ